jgi:hypothetical protein
VAAFSQITRLIPLSFHLDYSRRSLLRKEVIQPHLPVRLPCYDLAPVTGFALGVALLAVGQTTSGTPSFHGLTGGVYKARERIHRGVLIRDY